MTFERPPYTGDTLASILRQRAAATPQDVFIVAESATGQVRSVTFAELEVRATRLAHLLGSLGIDRGTRFHVHLPNCVEFLECLSAGARLGAIMVPTSPASTPDDLAYVLSHSGATLSVTEPALLQSLLEARDLAPDLGDVLLARSDKKLQGSRLLEPALNEYGAEPIPERATPDDPAVILYTSGTTGWPKGVEITHAGLLFAGTVVARALGVGPADRWLVTLPLFHGNALFYSTMSALVTGASLTLPESFDAGRWVELAVRHRATLASLFATQVRMVLTQPATEVEDDTDLRATVFAQHLADRQAAEFEHRFSCPLVQLYGMTETVAPALINPLSLERRHASLGRQIPDLPLRVIDAEDNDVAVGKIGELLVGGQPGRTMMRSYHDNAPATGEALRDGWLHTGDLVHVDEDGFYYFQGRSSDLLKPRIDNVSTAEIERVVMENWAVQECAAIGVPDPIQAEAIKLYVVRQPGEPLTHEEISDWCTQRLAEHKRPDLIEFADALPRTPVGKIDRHALR